MVCSMSSKALAILIVCIFINYTVADQSAAGGSTSLSTITTGPSIAPTPSPTTPSSSTGDASDNSPGSTGSESGGGGATTTALSDSSSVSATATMSSIMVASSGLAPSPAVNNSSIFNSTAPGVLPLKPTITPGFSAAGVLLMLSGTAYGLIGIRFKYLNVFFSAAYLTSLAVAVLIIYVMSLPVSHRLQGAYVAASIVAGLVVGGASLVLVEMMQGLGCLLGGFTLSMWLLTLRPGGLITSRGGRVGFLAAITLAGFCTSFSHVTRPYALIVFISFSGSTALVLGIDCFSRAGLKEFWVYLWDINPDLFAIGTDTYPLTRGIYAEIAVTIILSLAGIVSQTKLWKVVSEKHQQRVAGQLEDEKARAEEEANIGRNLESSNAREREEWEIAHGNKGEAEALQSDHDSGVSDMDGQKKTPVTTITSVLHPEENDIEVAPPEHCSQPTQVPLAVRGNSQRSNNDQQTKIDAAPGELDGNAIAGPTNRPSSVSTKHLSSATTANLEEPNPEMPAEVSAEAPNTGEPKSELSAEAPNAESKSDILAEVPNTGEPKLEVSAEVPNTEPESEKLNTEKLDREQPNNEEGVPDNLVNTEKGRAEADPTNEKSPVSENIVSALLSSTKQVPNEANSTKQGPVEKLAPTFSSPEAENGSSQEDASPHTLQSPAELPVAELNLNNQDARSSASLETSQTSMGPPAEDDLGPLPSSTPSTRRSSVVPFGDNTLMGRRDSMLRSKSFYSPSVNARDSTGSLPAQFNVSQRESGSGESMYNCDYGLHSSTSLLDDNMPLSARRSLLQQPSFSSNPPHLVRRQYSGPSPMAREQQLASFRMGIQRERHSSIVPNVVLERQRSMLWQERQVEGQKKEIEKRRKEERETAFDQTMRRGDMQNAHREAMRRMQAIANKHV